MREDEAEARKLVASLAELGVAAHVEGAGVHWHVDVLPSGGRSARVHCFWYERYLSGRIHGVNPANARSRLFQKTDPYEGPEFHVIIDSEGTHIADGRTHIASEVLRCIRAWLSGASLDDLVGEAPFIDAKRRAMKAVAARLDPRLVWDIGGDPAFDLWVYGGRRSARVTGECCAFLVGQAQVAFTQRTIDAPGDIAAWLLDGVPLASLAARGAELERHAEVIEIDPARWHWLHVRDRIANPNDVLFPLAPLIATLADSPVASRFFTYSSLNRLCFSASSHYPWVGDYPVVSPGHRGNYNVDGVSCGLQEAVTSVESALSASPVQPFFGSRPDHEIHVVAHSLAARGSTLQPEIIRRAEWSDIWLRLGSRRCRLAEDWITCVEGSSELTAACASLDDVVAVALRFLQDTATFAELAADPRVIRHQKGSA